MARYDLNEEAGEQDISKINAAGLINLRVQGSWDACTRYYRDGMFDELRDELASLWPEFYADAQKEDIEKMNKLNIIIAIAMKKKITKDRMTFIQASRQYKHAIYQKWLFLKQLEKNQGVGKAYIDKDAEDWD